MKSSLSQLFFSLVVNAETIKENLPLCVLFSPSLFPSPFEVAACSLPLTDIMQATLSSNSRAMHGMRSSKKNVTSLRHVFAIHRAMKNLQRVTLLQTFG